VKNLSLVLSIFICVSCSKLSANEIKPKLFTNYFTGLESEIVMDYQSIKLNYDLTLRSEKNVHFSTCKQVEETASDDIAVSEFHLLQMLKANCAALKQYSQAKSSNVSYLQEILDKKDISNLPATAYPYVNKHDKSQRRGKTLSEYHKKFNTSLDISGAIKVETETDQIFYYVVATGDFNADKVQDALIRIDWQVIDAFGKGFKLIMVTKESADKPYEITTLN